MFDYFKHKNDYNVNRNLLYS